MRAAASAGIVGRAGSGPRGRYGGGGAARGHARCGSGARGSRARVAAHTQAPVPGL